MRSGTSGSEEPPGGRHRGASLQLPTLELPTESGTGRSRPSPTPPRESSSPVRFLLNPLLPAGFYFLQRSVHVPVPSGNTSPRAISRAERERKVSMRLHRGAPANVSSSDLTARHDQSRISTSQVRKLLPWRKVWIKKKKNYLPIIYMKS